MKFWTIAFALVLSACGGGGGSGAGPATATPSASTAAFALDTAATNLLTNTQRFSLNALTKDKRQLGVVVDFSPRPDQTFEGRNAKVVDITSTFSENNLPALLNTERIFFSTNPFTVLGAITTGDLDGQNYEIVRSQSQLPATVNVGSKGPFTMAQFYTDSTKTVLSGSQTTTYSLEADTPSTAFFCLNSEIKNGLNRILATGSDCYKITPEGAILGMKLVVGVYDNGVLFETVTFQ